LIPTGPSQYDDFVSIHAPQQTAKIQNRAALVSLLADHRRQGRTIVFTNGCFDLMHVGHTRYLAEARTLGDVLVVGVNSDASVKALNKGADRPIVPDHQRAEVVAALAAVDYVTVFEEPDPAALIAALQPDVLVKGGDWPRHAIIGRETVEGRGGRVLTIPLVPDISTTMLIQRIRSADT
jgi:D-beta-D-heptose 7-phosphate kinase/D-beta-D-heptose 1-phosphate adenosyltransferase